MAATGTNAANNVATTKTPKNKIPVPRFILRPSFFDLGYDDTLNERKKAQSDVTGYWLFVIRKG
jgi:hypothetical protein